MPDLLYKVEYEDLGAAIIFHLKFSQYDLDILDSDLVPKLIGKSIPEQLRRLADLVEAVETVKKEKHNGS